MALSLASIGRPVAADAALDPSVAPIEERFAIHGQLTYVEQESGDFSAPYAGPNSLSPNSGRQTFDATLYLGARLWSGAEGWLNPEIDQGFGLDNTLGLAGFASGEAYKVGRKRPYLRLPRAFIRDSWALSADTETVDPGANQLGGTRARDRLVLTVGKFGVGDVFDTSPYAHDPRGDFLNWSVIDAGSFDYAADAWGFTVGAALEWYQGAWTTRIAAFALSDVPNSEHLEPGGHEFQLIGELEHHHQWHDLPGRIAVTGFESRGRMGLLADALRLAAESGGIPDVGRVRHYRSRSGLHLTAEQQLTATLGVFARAGGAGGNVEAYEFTDIDHSASAGLSLKGAHWRRREDTLGLAAVVNEISALRARYFDAGGLGILVGDGQLPHRGHEQILETYYLITPLPGTQLTVDYQHVQHPAYNRDRGPVSLYALRLHAQF